jgi:hypothetical protein
MIPYNGVLPADLGSDEFALLSTGEAIIHTTLGPDPPHPAQILW